MSLSPTERENLQRGAEAFGLSLDEEQLAGLGGYLELLDTWRRRSNLVSAADRAELLSRHVVDSLAAAPMLLSLGEARALDVGSGAGLPGVPLAIACPAARVTLLEPRRKRVSFLRAVCRECFTWNIQILEARTDELIGQGEAPYDAVVSRATFAPAELPGQVARLVAPGGLLIAYASASAPKRPLEDPGFEAPGVQEYQLPGHPAAFRLITWARRMAGAEESR